MYYGKYGDQMFHTQARVVVCGGFDELIHKVCVLCHMRPPKLCSIALVASFYVLH